MKSARLPVIDLIRLFSFLAIIIFHTSFTLWPAAQFDRVPEPSLWITPLETYARALSFSGFTVIFLSFFLFGFKAELKQNWFRLWLLMLAFFALWRLGGDDFPYIWDIYPYLLVVVALSALLRNWPGWLLAILGGILTSIPFWHFEPRLQLVDWLSGPIFGNCHLNDLDGDEWPLLPWIGYPIFAFGMGRLARKYENKLKSMSFGEIVFWSAALGISLNQIGEYYATPLGYRFGCFIFRRPPLTFWSHQIWIIFLVRLGYTRVVNTWLTRNRLVTWITQRPVNRKFYLAYFLHYPFCLVWAAGASHLNLNLQPWVFAAGVFACVIWVEYSTVVLSRILLNNKK